MQTQDVLLRDKVKKSLKKVLKLQGYKVHDTTFMLPSSSLQAKREVHNLSKTERLSEHRDFLLKKMDIATKNMINGSDLEIMNISPKLIEVKPDSVDENIFRWWNLAWWSLPYERAYGRQIRFLVWDDYHNAPIGLIGLQSPILSWSVRDNYLQIHHEKRDYWVNQSLSAQRLGALPPYNDVMGGKLIAYLTASNIVRETYGIKYKNAETILDRRKIPARLLFITTTGAYGKSSVYNRLKYKDQSVAKFIGYSKGSGSFHIPNSLYLDLLEYLKSEGVDTTRGYGAGPSRKLRLIDTALSLLGFTNGSKHGVTRAVYLFPFADNLSDVISNEAKPHWYDRSVKNLTDYWKEHGQPNVQMKIARI